MLELNLKKYCIYIYICDRLCEKGAYGAENKNVFFNLF